MTQNKNNIVSLIELDSLIKDLECILCLNTVSEPCICIYCSTIVCTKCIQNCLDKTESCPKCSHSVRLTDYVKCRLADKLIEFIEITKLNNCTMHSKETPRVYCSTCHNYVCFECISINGEHINHEYKLIDENYKKILILNHQLINFIKTRRKENQDKLNEIELTIDNLFNKHNENVNNIDRPITTNDSLIQQTEHLFNEYEQKRVNIIDRIKNDDRLLNDIEQQLKQSKGLSDQEEILQRLQRHIQSKIE